MFSSVLFCSRRLCGRYFNRLSPAALISLIHHEETESKRKGLLQGSCFCYTGRVRAVGLRGSRLRRALRSKNKFAKSVPLVLELVSTPLVCLSTCFVRVRPRVLFVSLAGVLRLGALLSVCCYGGGGSGGGDP
ncbi:unnamed protein product, partial [Scytosiphon promiscuus]